MQKESSLKYSIIIPIHNEEKFIGNTLNAVINQTLLPQELILVNDNSSDQSMEIITEFSKKYSFIQIIESGSKSNLHEPGSKIINAFYKGFETINFNWDVIVKLDADAILPKDYFEKIISTFESDKNIGIAGGLAMIEINGKWEYEKIGNKKQVRGPFKAYSKDCFEKIGGIRKSIGWDTVDELLARYYGFEIQVLAELEVKLQKPTGKDYSKIHGFKTGQAFYRMDYGMVIGLIAAIKAAWNKKSLKLFIDISKGFWSSMIHTDKKIVSKEEGKFIRNFRWKGILNKVFQSVKNE